MIPSSRAIGRAIAIYILSLPVCARVVPVDQARSLFERGDAAVCGGIKGLDQCGGSFPDSFCCPSSAYCLRLNGTSAHAAICCPNNSDCSAIATISCDRSQLNPKLNPGSPIHSTPVASLVPCGQECCPMGYECQNGGCVQQYSAQQSSSSSSTTSASTTSSTPLGQTSVPSSSSIIPAVATGIQPTSAAAPSPMKTDNGQTTSGSSPSSSHGGFNGGSFAAGFVPGIAIGALAVALLVFFYLRRKSGGSMTSCVDEKRRSRDTLTDLGTAPVRRPTNHLRSISEPTPDPTFGYRSDFLRGSPPSANGVTSLAGQKTKESPESVETASRKPKSKSYLGHALFTTFPTTPVQPAQVPVRPKRSTSSLKITPVRALKKQRSLHSLRRQITNASRITNPSISDRSSTRKPHVSGSQSTRSRSTETIQVLMTNSDQPITPDRRAQLLAERTPELEEPSYDLPDSATTWDEDEAHSVHGDALGITSNTQIKPTYMRRSPVSTVNYTTMHSTSTPLSTAVGNSASSRKSVPQSPPENMPKVRAASPATHTGASYPIRLGSPYTTPETGRNKPVPAVPTVEMHTPGLHPHPLQVARPLGERASPFSAHMERVGLREEDLAMLDSSPSAGKGRRKLTA